MHVLLKSMAIWGDGSGVNRLRSIKRRLDRFEEKSIERMSVWQMFLLSYNHVLKLCGIMRMQW